MQLAVIRRFPPRATTPTSGRGLGYKKTDFGVFPDARDVPADPPWGGLRSICRSVLPMLLLPCVMHCVMCGLAARTIAALNCSDICCLSCVEGLGLRGGERMGADDSVTGVDSVP